MGNMGDDEFYNEFSTMTNAELRKAVERSKQFTREIREMKKGYNTPFLAPFLAEWDEDEPELLAWLGLSIEQKGKDDAGQGSKVE